MRVIPSTRSTKGELSGGRSRHDFCLFAEKDPVGRAHCCGARRSGARFVSITENPRVRKSGVMDGGVRSSVLGGELW